MQIAALQISSVGLSPNRLDYYCKIAKAKDVELLLLPEFVLNSFFHELTSMPLSMVAQQSQAQMEFLKDLSKRYGIAIVAPIVRIVKKRPYKVIAIVKGERVYYYEQQILISYSHWNEEKFFANEPKELTPPFMMRLDGCKIAVMAGFEVHFDYFWLECMKKDVDIVLVPSAATFNSNKRWKELLKSEAFKHNCYVVRANRIGEYRGKEHTWRFYGHSFAIDPGGEVVVELGESEELLIVNVEKESIKEAKRAWGFRRTLKKRGLL